MYNLILSTIFSNRAPRDTIWHYQALCNIYCAMTRKDDNYSVYYYGNYKKSTFKPTAISPKTDKKNRSKVSREKPAILRSARRKSNKRGIVAALLLIVCFFATVLGVDYFSNGFVLAAFDNVEYKKSETVYFGVRLGYFSDKNTAVDFAKDVRARAGAGYICAGKNYEVIAAIYGDEAKAKSIADRFNKNNMSAEIVKIVIPPLNIQSLGADYTAVCRETLTSFDRTYNVLYALSNDLDANAITPATALLDINSLISEIVSAKQNFADKTDSFPHIAIVKITAALVVMQESVSEIINYTDRYLSAAVRHSYSAIIYSYQALASELSTLK